MFNRLKTLVNKARALGSKKWTDDILMKRLIMTYTQMNYNIVVLIYQDSAYKKMSSDNVVGRIINHEMNTQETNNIKYLYKYVSTSKKENIALKANKKTRIKF
jgi:phage-related protein